MAVIAIKEFRLYEAGCHMLSIHAGNILFLKVAGPLEKN